MTGKGDQEEKKEGKYSYPFFNVLFSHRYFSNISLKSLVRTITHLADASKEGKPFSIGQKGGLHD
jgi:hypothetical protein